jgi:hypothetical protein
MGAHEQIVFDEESHTYWIDRVQVPSVTQILRPLVDLSGIPSDVLERKRDLGTRVHFACQLDDEGDLDESSVEDDVAPYLAAYRLFKRESGAQTLLNEHRVAEPKLMYAGTLDRVLLIDRQRWLVDLKTSLVLPLLAGPQTAAYQRALADPRVTHRGALRLRPDRKYRFDVLAGPDDWSCFLAARTLHQYQRQHA